MSKKKLTLVRADDWEGLYVGDNLVTEGHSIDLQEALEAVGMKLVVRWEEDAIAARTRCFDKLSEYPCS